MRINLMIEGQEGVTWEQWLALAQAAEDAGLEGLFRSDHYRSIMNVDPAGSLDAWAATEGWPVSTEVVKARHLEPRSSKLAAIANNVSRAMCFHEKDRFSFKAEKAG